jgi:DNA-binding CsgD family transcriptional regulator/energy-coupling factor transporter ATP-binding protein EcfA2
MSEAGEGLSVGCITRQRKLAREGTVQTAAGSSDIVERDREVAALGRAIETGGAVLVVGPFGVGKSTLLAVARALAAEAGATVLEARGSDAERKFAYGVLRQLLGDEAALQPAAVLASLAEIGAQGPLCVIVDDLDRADSPSLAALSHVVAHRANVAVVAAAESALDGWEVLRPAPLSPDGVRAVLAADPETARACHEATDGLPLLVSEVVGELRRTRRTPSGAAIAEVVERPPPAVQRMVARRLAGLPDETVQAAHAASIRGEDDVLERLGFTSPLTRSAVRQTIPPSARSRLHARAARELADAGAPASVVARHILEAPQDAVPGAAAILTAAVSDAQHRGELATVARYLRRRVDEFGRPDAVTLAMLGSAELRLGRMEPAAAHLARSVEVIEEPGDRLGTIAELGTALIYQGRAAEAMDILAPAVAAARAAGSDTVHVLEATQAVAGWSDHGVFRRLREALPAMAGEAGTPRTDGEYVRLGRIAAEHAMHGSALDARAVAARGSGERLGEGRHLVVFHLRELALVLADDPTALAALAAVEAQARRLGSSVALEIVRALWVTALLRRGELDAAELDAEAPIGSLATVAVAECRMERGDLQAAADALEHARRAHFGWRVDLFRLLALGRLQARQGQLEEALATFAKCARIEEAWGFTEPAHASWRTEAALAHHALGDREAATALALESMERTRRYGSERLQGMALVAAARVGCGGPPRDRLQEAIELLDRVGAALEAARARAEYGSLLRRDGNVRAARRPLREAAAMATGAGATELHRRVMRELELTGAARQRRDRDELTAAERRTAELAAEGLTNREIASRLLLAEKTVEMQLSRVYRKLGIRSRKELGRERP